MLSVASTFEQNQRFELVYDNMTKEVAFDFTKSSTIVIDKDLEGKEFNGFSGNEYYVSFNVIGNSISTIALDKINGSAFSNEQRDYVGPRISFLGDYGGEYKLGSVYTLTKAIISDVLDGRVDVEVTVENPDEDFMVSVEGKKLNSYKIDEDETISIKLNDYGVYFITYYAVDSYNNKLPFTYTVNVIDDTKPVIKLASALPEQVTVGSKVHIPKATVKDDKDKNLTCTVMLILPTGRVETFDTSVDTGFIAGETGCYNVIYQARDSEGNVTNLVYTVRVVEG